MATISSQMALTAVCVFDDLDPFGFWFLVLVTKPT